MKLYTVGKSPRRLPSYPSHRHPRWELICNICGSGTMCVDGRVYPYQTGTVLLCPPGTMHEKQSEAGFEDVYIQFDGCDIEPRVYVLDDDPESHVFTLTRLLHNAWFDGTDRSLCQKLFDVLMELLRPAVQERENRFVGQLRRRIAENFTDPSLRLGALMDTLPLGQDHLRRLFKQELGQTPGQYLTALRLEHAAGLLRSEGISVSEAAYRSGFEDALYFSRLFRKHMGIPPSRWK